ncbi:MAG TPA: glycosyltransferase family 4 protein [Stellaceae bacterium]|jgi:UDP-N-acetylmuramyl pentapeptide phosphotransferase/UDP-N-acetylglucosamine-1-phosphate transferase|nr:glycosyltransferase family 4 protein [Stellaceae bacterium]
MTAIFIVAALAWIGSWAGTWAMIRWLTERGIFDRPGERSSHDRPVPKGAGAAVVTVLLLIWITLALTGFVPRGILGISALAFVLAAVSWRNDLRDMSVTLRLVVQIAAVIVALLGWPGRGLLFQGFLPAWLDQVLTAVTWVWFINVFNFMDGADGMTGVETVVIGIGVSVIGAFTGFGPEGYLLLGVTLAAVAAGFLPWNWYPARVFLGDVGSVPLGFVVGWLLLELAGHGYWAPALLLSLYYLSDASLTLFRRVIKGEPFWRAHRMHCFQRALERDGNHAAVVRLVLAGSLALAGAALAAVWQPVLALGAGAAITGALMVGLIRRGREPQGDWRSVRATALRDGHP